MRSDARAPGRGFTLLETVCTLIILGVLGSLVLSGFGTALSGYTRVREAGASYMQAELALIDGQVLLSDVASCRFTSNGAGPSSIGIVLTRQLAGRQATWTLSVAPRNTPPAKE